MARASATAAPRKREREREVICGSAARRTDACGLHARLLEGVERRQRQGGRCARGRDKEKNGKRNGIYGCVCMHARRRDGCHGEKEGARRVSVGGEREKSRYT